MNGGSGLSRAEEQLVSIIREPIAEPLVSGGGVDLSHFEGARKLFVEEVGGTAYRGCFISLCCEFHATDPYTHGKKQSDIYYLLRFMHEGLWKLTTVIARLDWMRRRSKEDNHIDQMWTDYASLDIEQWHVGLRSILDHLALVVRVLAGKKAQQLPESFDDLFKLAQKIAPNPAAHPSAAQRLGPDWLKLIGTAKWFPKCRAVRDQLVHFGGRPMVFGNPSQGILFQVHSGGTGRNIVSLPPPFMFNKNVVYFERYAAHVMAHLLVFLEEFARIAYERTGRIREGNDSWSLSIGFRALMQWIDSTVAAMPTEPG